ncbi:MAG: class I SAM-dependent methyltransferase [Niabella sp.]
MDEIIHYTNCPVCGSEDLHKVFTVKDYTVSGKHFDILECGACSLRFTQDVPIETEIGAYYQSEQYISHTNTNKGLINQLYQRVRNVTMKQKCGIVKKYTGMEMGRLLDIGCGTGTFLHTMKGQGWLIKGLEPYAGAREKAKDLYGLHILPSPELFNLPENYYDAITLWHVLEHVHNLHGYVERIRDIISDKGKVFIAVPNYTSADATKYQEYWAAYDVPRHLYHFSPRAMNILLDKHRLQVVKILPMWFDSYYVCLLSSRYKTGHNDYISGGFNGLLSNMNAMGNTATCSSLIYVIKRK